MKLSIGILAYNEADSIGITLRSLFRQSIFQVPSSHTRVDAIEVVVVANGCTDNTSTISREILTEVMESSPHPHFTWKVYDVEQPSKPNAWNLYIHKFSDPAADYFIVMDADIEILEAETLESLINTLEEDPNAWVSVDKLVKDVEFKQKKTLIEKLSIAVSKVRGDKSAWISQLYCGRASRLRNVWLPLGIIVEDGYLWSMMATDSLTCPQNVLDRVVRAKSASHIFEAYTNISSLLRHEVRQVMGNTINTFVYRDLKANCTQAHEVNLLVKTRNEQDPLWVNKLIGTAVTQKGWWVIDRWILLRRFLSLRYTSFNKAILLFPISCIAFLVDLFVCLQANSELHRWSHNSDGETQTIDKRYWRLDW